MPHGNKGRVLHSNDAWIAATAMRVNAPLVTHNANDFDYLQAAQVVSAP